MVRFPRYREGIGDAYPDRQPTKGNDRNPLEISKDVDLLAERRFENMIGVLLVGNGAREHVLAETIVRSTHKPCLYSFMKANNPGIVSLSKEVRIGNYRDPEPIVRFARDAGVSLAVIGPEDPLNNGVSDAITAAGIPVIGPLKNLARLETSKSFTRDLVQKFGIPGNPRYRTFSSADGIAEFLDEIGAAVIKPDGLTGGKGVLVQGEHFTTSKEGLKHCAEILREHPSVTIEEKLEGEEFSLQCFCDGTTVVPMPAVQDHKRRFAGDTGPNTGGMGSYSCEDHLLPFLRSQDVQEGLEITRRVAEALRIETGKAYKGILYGGFMVTRHGIRLLEYNARFGDPEAMNVLPLLSTDFIDLCQSMAEGTLDRLFISFDRKATVCKYVVPCGYGLPKDHPGASSTSARIEIGDIGNARLYYSSVDQRKDGLYMTASRAIGIVGVAGTVQEAERIAENAVHAVAGPVDHRPDIGTDTLIRQRVDHVQRIRNRTSALS